MISVVVASSALPMGSNVKSDDIIIRMIMMMIMMITIIVTPFASPVLPNKRW